MKKNWKHLVLAGMISFGTLGTFTPSVYASSLGDSVAADAIPYIGQPLGSYSPGYFISYIYKKEGTTVSSNLSTLFSTGTSINHLADLQPGDVLFFGTSPSQLIASGIYLGNSELALAYKPYNTVRKLSLSSTLFKNNYIGARRYASTEVSTPSQPVASNDIRQKIIDAGMKYLGTPYEYSSSRASKTTMDCSEFTYWSYLEGGNIKLPQGSKYQADYVWKNGYTKTDWRSLKPGDLMFFMDYKGSKASDYANINVSKQTISHVAIYLGNGKILHTYSKTSGGVRVDSIGNNHWEYRFVFGGSTLPQK